MSFLYSLLFFGLPGVAVVIGIYWIAPIAVDHGVPVIVAWTTALWLPVLLLLIWVFYQNSGGRVSQSFRAKYRLAAMTKSHWVVVLAAFLLLQISELLLAPTAATLSQLGVLQLPRVLPDLFDPRVDVTSGLETFLGVPVLGNWYLVLFWLGWLIMNIGGEELLWRGYALPRQERKFGKYAWLVNGLCWNLVFHAFMWWNYVLLMPISLTIPFLVQRYKNTWIGIYIHGLGNLLVLAILIPSIAGWL